MITEQELDALIQLAVRAPMSPAELLWFQQLTARIQAEQRQRAQAEQDAALAE